jgi:hypothetical protein
MKVNQLIETPDVFRHVSYDDGNTITFSYSNSSAKYAAFAFCSLSGNNRYFLFRGDEVILDYVLQPLPEEGTCSMMKDLVKRYATHDTLTQRFDTIFCNYLYNPEVRNKENGYITYALNTDEQERFNTLNFKRWRFSGRVFVGEQTISLWGVLKNSEMQDLSQKMSTIAKRMGFYYDEKTWFVEMPRTTVECSNTSPKGCYDNYANYGNMVITVAKALRTLVNESPDRCKGVRYFNFNNITFTFLGSYGFFVKAEDFGEAVKFVIINGKNILFNDIINISVEFDGVVHGVLGSLYQHVAKKLKISLSDKRKIKNAFDYVDNDCCDESGDIGKGRVFPTRKTISFWSKKQYKSFVGRIVMVCNKCFGTTIDKTWQIEIPDKFADIAADRFNSEKGEGKFLPLN